MCVKAFRLSLATTRYQTAASGSPGKDSRIGGLKARMEQLERQLETMLGELVVHG